MKLAQVKTKTVSAASAADLDTAIAAFVTQAAEATYLDIRILLDGAVFAATIIYVD